MLKKLWNMVTGLFATKKEVAEEREVRVTVFQEVVQPTPKPLSYWAEYAEKLQPQVDPAEEQQKQDRARREAIREWKANNRAVDAYFRSKTPVTNRRERNGLYVVQSVAS